MASTEEAATSTESSPPFKIVALEAFYCPIAGFDIPSDLYTLDVYEKTPRNDLELLKPRVLDASVLILTTLPLTSTILSPDFTPKLRLVVVSAVGTDCIDLDACRKRGIRVLNAPRVNTEAVAQHAMMLYFATRKKLGPLQRATVEGNWTRDGSLIKRLNDQKGSAPMAWGEEVVGVFGYGAVGQKIASICRSLGMTVLVAGRPGEDNVSSDSGRVPFNEVLTKATVVFLSLPRTPSTLNLFSTSEFSIMSPSAILVNVSRGGIVDETALIEALLTYRIAGAGTDVFETEPAGPENSTLLKALAEDKENKLNLTVTPHVAWCSDTTTKNLQRMAKENVEGWFGVEGKKIPKENVII